MKNILTLAFLLPFFSNAQFGTLEWNVLNTKGRLTPGFAVTFTGGGFLKSASGKREVMLGAGASAYFVDESTVIPALFMTTGYYNPSKKISPFINIKAGYAFYKGSGTWAEVHSNRGGFFTDARAGAGFKLTKLMRIAPHIGVNGFMLRYVVGRETTESHFVAVLNGGVALIFTR